MTQPYLQAKAIAIAALECHATQRQAYLEVQCAGNPALRQEVEWLMRAAETHSGDSGLPGWDEVPAAAATLPEGAQVAASVPGQYRILRQLGEGGMGVVYLAERTDGDTRQSVALKFLNTGSASNEPLAQRLADERRILATLNHPNIAHLVDGGTTADGRPFIAMEYVDGERIDRWCADRELPLRARVALFLQVCAAVEHAHQRLVIHRDLKPANILVTAEGQPKLLDFGIARLLEGDVAGPTQTGHRALTLAYASPEQIEGRPLTTAADIWSLGVVLYELLAGMRPYQDLESGHLLPNAIVSGEITPPSRRSGRHARDTATNAATPFAATAVGLPRIPADIDAIALKALRRDADQRYASVRALADDLQRFLDSRPVLARRGHALYRMRRFAWRHRWSLGVAAAVVVLVAGFAMDRVQQLHRVEAERNKALALAGFMSDLFANADPSQSRGEQVTVREVLDRGAQTLATRTDLDPATQAELMLAIGDAYGGLQLSNRSLPLLQQSLHALETIGAAPEQRAQVLFKIANAQSLIGENTLAIAATRRGQVLLASNRDQHFKLWADLRLLEMRNIDLMGAAPPEQQIEPLKRLISTLHARGDGAFAESLGQAYEALANAYQRAGNVDAAIGNETKALEYSRKSAAKAPAAHLTVRMNHAAMVLQRDPAQGVALLQALDRDYVRLVGEYTPSHAVLLNQLGGGLSLLGRKQEALDAMIRATEIARRSAGADNRLYLQLGVAKALRLMDNNRLAEAETTLRDVLPGLQARSAPGVDAVNYAYALGALGRAKLGGGHDAAGAVAVLEKAEQVLGKNAGEYLVVYNNILEQRVRAHLMLHQPSQAQQAIDRYQALLDAQHEPADSAWRKKLDALRSETATAGRLAAT